MAAAPLADVLVGHPHPAVGLRLGDHRLEQTAVGLLLLAPARQLGLGLLKAHGEGVANPLEIGGVEHAGASDGANAPLDTGPGERRCEEATQPRFESRNLTAQVGSQAALSRQCLPPGRDPGLCALE